MAPLISQAAEVPAPGSLPTTPMTDLAALVFIPCGDVGKGVSWAVPLMISATTEPMLADSLSARRYCCGTNRLPWALDQGQLLLKEPRQHAVLDTRVSPSCIGDVRVREGILVERVARHRNPLVGTDSDSQNV